MPGSRRIKLALIVVCLVGAAAVVWAVTLRPPSARVSSNPLLESSSEATETTATASLVETGAAGLGSATVRTLAKAENDRALPPVVGSVGGEADDRLDGTDAASGSSGGAKDRPESELVFGLTLEDRKSCYWELIQAEDRAVAEAESKYPLGSDKQDIEAHMALRFSLMEQYKSALSDKYGVTSEQLTAIADEGVRGRWPMPPLS